MFLFVAFYPSKTQDEPTLKPEFKKFGVPILEGFGQLINAENVPIFQKLAEYIHNKKDLKESYEKFLHLFDFDNLNNNELILNSLLC